MIGEPQKAFLKDLLDQEWVSDNLGFTFSLKPTMGVF